MYDLIRHLPIGDITFSFGPHGSNEKCLMMKPDEWADKAGSYFTFGNFGIVCNDTVNDVGMTLSMDMLSEY